MPIESEGTVLVKTPDNPAGTNKSVSRWHGTVRLSDMNLIAENDTEWGVANGMYVLNVDMYIDSDTVFDVSIQNITIDIRDKNIYIHPDADIKWQDVLFFSSTTRRANLATIFPEGCDWNADGGGILAAMIDDGNTDRLHVRIGEISNVQIRQDNIGDNDIRYLPLNKKATYRNIKALKVQGVNTDGTKNASDRPAILHDCEFRSSAATGSRVGPVNNASMILNDCIFGRMDRQDPTPAGTTSADSWMFDYTSGGVTSINHDIYFCGLTKTRWSPNWLAPAGTKKLHSHQGGLRYYQVYKDGAIFGGCRYRLYSDRNLNDGNPAVRAHRHSQVNIDTQSLLDLPTADMPATGEFSCLTIAKTRSFNHTLNSWETALESNHTLRIRERTILFQDVSISDATLSIGRPDTPVPFVVQPDPHFDELFADTTIHSSELVLWVNPGLKRIRVESGASFTIAALYAHLKIQFTAWDNFEHEFDITFDGDTLRLPGWTFELNANSQLYAGNGTRIICETLNTIPVTATVHPGVTIIDSSGVTVTISSPAPNSRCMLTYDGQTNAGFGNLPYTESVPLDTEVKVTIKAPGYVYETYTFNTNTQTQLDARLPKDPSIDLSITLSSAEKNAVDVLSGHNAFWVPLSNANDCEILVNSINLYSQLGKSKRLIDWVMSVNDAALYYLHNYTDELTGAPLQGKAFVFESDRMRIDDTKLQFRRGASVSSRCRLGLPVWTAGDQAYFAPFVTLQGTVHFDSLAAVADIPADTLAATIETISTNDVYTGALSRAMWNYLTTESLQDDSFGKIIKDNLDAKISKVLAPEISSFGILTDRIAGGGLAPESLSSGLSHHQLYHILHSTTSNNGIWTEVRLYDADGNYDRSLLYGADVIPGAQWSIYYVYSGIIHDGYLWLGIRNPNSSDYGIHRIPLDSSDTARSYTSRVISFRPVGLCINGSDVVILDQDDNNIRLHTMPTSLQFDPTQVVSIADDDHSRDYMGLSVVGSDEGQVLVVCSGTKRMLEYTLNYTYVKTVDLPYSSMGVMWWRDHVWTVSRHSWDEWYMEPLDIEYNAVRHEYLTNLIKTIPDKIWKVPGNTVYHEVNTIGSALMSSLVGLDILLDGNLTNTKLANLSNLSDIAGDVWGYSILNPVDGTMKKLIRDLLTRLNDQHDTLAALPVPPTADTIKTTLEADGSDLDTIANTVHSISARVQKIDGQTAATGNYGWVKFPANTYATGYVNHDDILSLILQDTDASHHVIGKRIHTDTGLGIEDHTYHPITLTNKRIITVADSPTDTYFVVLDTDNNTYHVYQQNHGEQTTPVSVQLTQEPKALAWGPHGLYILEVVSGNLNLRWTYNSTSQDYDTEITAGSGTASMVIIGDIAYILHGGTLRAIRIADESSGSAMIDGVGSSLSGDNLIEMHNVLWVYDEGRLYPLDGNHTPINTEWALTQRARIDDKITDVKDTTDKIRFTGDGSTESPYRVDAHAAGITASDLTIDFTETNQKIDDVKTVVDLIPQTSYTDTLTTITDSLTALTSSIGSIPTAAQHTLQQIADAVRDMSDYDDDEGTETSLKETLKVIISDIDTLEKQLLLDTVDSNDTLLKRIKDSKTILNKLHFTGDDVKATLDGEKVTTDDASRTASKATGFSTPANIDTAETNIKTAITAAHTITDGKVDTAITNIGNARTDISVVDTVVDDIKTEITADEIDDGTGTSTNRETLKKTVDDIETKVDTTVTQTTADAISSAVESAFLDDDDGLAFLQQIYDKIEQAIEDESLAQNALAIAIRREVWQHIVNPDDAEADQVNAQNALNNAREQINDVVDVQLPAAAKTLTLIITACNWLVSVDRADVEQDGEFQIVRDRETKEEIIRFKNRGSAGKIDWSAGRHNPADDDDDET